MQLIQYNEKQYKILTPENADQAIGQLGSDSVNWLHINELTNPDIVEPVCRHFGLHHLIVEDIQNVNHLPKFETFDDYLFLTLKKVRFDESGKFERIHCSFVLTKNTVVTFQENSELFDFEQVKKAITDPKRRLRKLKVDYLFYLLLDVVVDNYLLLIEKYREKMEDLETLVLEKPSNNVVEQILEIKAEINQFRRFALPLRDIIGKIKNTPSKFIKNTTATYLQDVYDHLVHLVTGFETSREMLKDLMDLHLSNLSFMMNKVMRTLTVVATIFIPLTFLAGIYGMNFKYMPELDWRYSYPVLLAIMLIAALAMLVFMKRKRWF